MAKQRIDYIRDFLSDDNTSSFNLNSIVQDFITKLKETSKEAFPKETVDVIVDHTRASEDAVGLFVNVTLTVTASCKKAKLEDFINSLEKAEFYGDYEIRNESEGITFSIKKDNLECVSKSYDENEFGMEGCLNIDI